MAELKFEIVKEFGVLSQSPSGWTKELNLVSWNDRAPKYDIREWAPDHTKMGKGVTKMCIRDRLMHTVNAIGERLSASAP